MRTLPVLALGLLLCSAALAQRPGSPAPEPRPGSGPRPGTTAPAGDARPGAGAHPGADGRPGADARPGADRTGSAPAHPDAGRTGAAPAQPPAIPFVKPKPTLVCSFEAQDGTHITLPSKHKPRIESPIQCTLEGGPGTAGQPWKAALWTVRSGKPGTQHVLPLTGAPVAKAALSLTPGEEYDACEYFDIKAELRDASGKALWKKAVKIKQDCPD